MQNIVVVNKKILNRIDRKLDRAKQGLLRIEKRIDKMRRRAYEYFNNKSQNSA